MARLWLAAFDADGQPTKAAAAWAASNGITAEQAERLETDKGAWLIHKAAVLKAKAQLLYYQL